MAPGTHRRERPVTARPVRRPGRAVRLAVTTKPVACLRHEEPDDLGVGRDVLPVEYVDLWREDPPALDDVAGLIVLGGEMNADQVEDYPFLAAERELLGRAVNEGVPLLGICLGAQL